MSVNHFVPAMSVQATADELTLHQISPEEEKAMDNSPNQTMTAGGSSPLRTDDVILL